MENKWAFRFQKICMNMDEMNAEYGQKVLAMFIYVSNVEQN